MCCPLAISDVPEVATLNLRIEDVFARLSEAERVVESRASSGVAGFLRS